MPISRRGGVFHGWVKGLGEHEADAHLLDALLHLLRLELDLHTQCLQHVG